MTRKLNVESFNLDHTKVKAPFVRLVGVIKGEKGDEIHKYDIRFKQPNVEHMEMAAIHSLEHMLAEYSRNYSDKIVDVSPMGCQTGYYLSVINHNDYKDILNILENVLQDILNTQKVPAATEVQCGYAASHDLEAAKQIARSMLDKKSEWTDVF